MTDTINDNHKAEVENLDHFSHAYPNLKQAFIIIGLFLLINILISIPLIVLSYELQGTLEMTPLLYFIIYVGTFSLVILFGWRQASRTMDGGVVFAFTRVPGFLYPMLFVTTLALILLTDPLVNWIPMPDFIFKAFASLLSDKSIWTFLLLVVAAPLLEEALFRGIILRGFLKNYSPGKAIVWSSILFGLVHLNPWQFIPALILGVFIGWLYWRTGSLLPGIFVHFVANGSGFVSGFFLDFDKTRDLTTQQLFNNDLLYFSLLLLSLILTVYLIRVIDARLKTHAGGAR